MTKRTKSCHKNNAAVTLMKELLYLKSYFLSTGNSRMFLTPSKLKLLIFLSATTDIQNVRVNKAYNELNSVQKIRV